MDITLDFKKVLFANITENFILEINDGFFIQKKLSTLKNKVVYFSSSDPDSSGFFFVASSDYEQELAVEHTNQNNFRLSFERDIEPKTLTVFDICHYDHSLRKSMNLTR